MSNHAPSHSSARHLSKNTTRFIRSWKVFPSDMLPSASRAFWTYVRPGARWTAWNRPAASNQNLLLAKSSSSPPAATARRLASSRFISPNSAPYRPPSARSSAASAGAPARTARSAASARRDETSALVKWASRAAPGDREPSGPISPARTENWRVSRMSLVTCSLTNLPFPSRSTRYFNAAAASAPCKLAEYDAASMGNSVICRLRRCDDDLPRSSDVVKSSTDNPPASMINPRCVACSNPTPPPASARYASADARLPATNSGSAYAHPPDRGAR
mmetsp:Transcript_4260/g.10857  ORF Transcript_4260/g.10857 Transcript_4260/m.10857 type:complete len:275 (-) Transcript_4260:736-1560(-)